VPVPRNRIEVSAGALRHNVRLVRRLCGERALIAVVKADAYRLGLERCARIYHEAGAVALAVATINEAHSARYAVPDARILIMGTLLPEERTQARALRCETFCSSLDEADAWAALGEATEPHRLHIFIDTGMGRAGCAPEQARALRERIDAARGLALAGVGTHYPDAVCDAFSDEQEQRMHAALDSLGPLGDEVLLHCANSEALLSRSNPPGNAARIGMLLAGAVPVGCEDPGLRITARWLSALSLVKRLPAGHPISYGRTAVLERESTVAMVPIGYADGYPWALSGRARVLIGGRSCPVLGRVTMDSLLIDCSELPEPATVGMQAVLLGEDGTERITVNELAERAGSIPHDILCRPHLRCELLEVD